MWGALLALIAQRMLFVALHLESGSFPRPLSLREERDCFAQLHSTDKTSAAAAREKLIRHNLRLVSHIAKKYYAKKCRDIDIIHLNGSIEIAPILDLSDVIVDIVETGKTLKENNLSPFEDIVSISARLIANKSAYGFKGERVEEIKKGLLKQVKQDND